MLSDFYSQFQVVKKIAPVVLLALLLPTPGGAQPCPWVVSPPVSQKLYDALRALPPGDCALADQTVSAGVVAQVWKIGQQSVPLQWTPRACEAGDDGRLQPLALAAFARSCPKSAAALQRAQQARDFAAAIRPIPLGKTQVLDADYDLVHVTAALELLALLGLLAWLLLAWRRSEPAELAWWQTGAALLMLALAMRFAVPPALSNWYTTALGQADTPAVDRYGSGHIALQWLLRLALPWGDRAIFGANQVLGAGIVPLWLVALRQRGLSLRTAGLAAGLLAVLPLHVRLSASASEHVLAAFFWIAALGSWQAALRSRTRAGASALGVLAGVLALLTALTRVDTAAPLLAIAGWVLLADRCEPSQRWPRRLIFALLWLVVWAAALAVILPLVHVAVVEQGTPMPHLAERLQALHDFLPGVGRLCFAAPGWIGPLVGGAALVGLVIGLRDRPLLTLTAAASVLAVPIGIGRSPYDFILMRYYLPILPVVTLWAALALAPLARRRWVTPLLLLAVAALGWPAWHVQYTFQAEYNWLRAELQRQPANCTVAQIGVSHRRARSNDVDCCLDLTRCPLVAELPGRQFLLTDTREDLQDAPGQCLLYYEGAACALQPTPELRKRNPAELSWFQNACTDVRRTAGLTPLAQAVVTPYSHTDAFAGKPVTVRLWRVKR